MKTKVIVCGGRDFQDYDLCQLTLDFYLRDSGDNYEIISGHAKGADSLGERYAKDNNIELKIFPADWGKYGRQAGPIRNQQMLDYAMQGHPIVIAFWDGRSRGTKNMIEISQKAGVTTYIEKYGIG